MGWDEPLRERAGRGTNFVAAHLSRSDSVQRNNSYKLLIGTLSCLPSLRRYFVYSEVS